MLRSRSSSCLPLRLRGERLLRLGRGDGASEVALTGAAGTDRRPFAARPGASAAPRDRRRVAPARRGAASSPGPPRGRARSAPACPASRSPEKCRLRGGCSRPHRAPRIDDSATPSSPSVPSNTVIARPLTVTRSPRNSTPTRPTDRRPGNRTSESRSRRSAPIRARAPCVHSRDRILRQPCLRCEDPRDEVVGRPSAAGRWGSDRPRVERVHGLRSGRRAPGSSSSLSSSAIRNALFVRERGRLDGRAERARHRLRRAHPSPGRTRREIHREGPVGGDGRPSARRYGSRSGSASRRRLR